MEAIEKAGIAFLGPTSATMKMFSRKHTAREFAVASNVPVLPGEPQLTCLPNVPFCLLQGKLDPPFILWRNGLSLTRVKKH